VTTGSPGKGRRHRVRSLCAAPPRKALRRHQIQKLLGCRIARGRVTRRRGWRKSPPRNPRPRDRSQRVRTSYRRSSAETDHVGTRWAAPGHRQDHRRIRREAHATPRSDLRPRWWHARVRHGRLPTRPRASPVRTLQRATTATPWRGQEGRRRWGQERGRRFDSRHPLGATAKWALPCSSSCAKTANPRSQSIPRTAPPKPKKGRPLDWMQNK